MTSGHAPRRRHHPGSPGERLKAHEGPNASFDGGKHSGYEGREEGTRSRCHSSRCDFYLRHDGAVLDGRRAGEAGLRKGSDPPARMSRASGGSPVPRRRPRAETSPRFLRSSRSRDRERWGHRRVGSGRRRLRPGHPREEWARVQIWPKRLCSRLAQDGSCLSARACSAQHLDAVATPDQVLAVDARRESRDVRRPAEAPSAKGRPSVGGKEGVSQVHGGCQTMAGAFPMRLRKNADQAPAEAGGSGSRGSHP